MDQPTADEALRRLDRCRRVDDRGPTPGRRTMAGGGRSTFEWHPSGAYLVQHTIVELPEAPDSVSIIGCDGASGTYIQLYSDERGVYASTK